MSAWLGTKHATLALRADCAGPCVLQAASSNGAAPAGGSGDSEPAVSFMVNAQAKGSSPKALTKPEILSPVGGWPQMRAAVENGADAGARKPLNLIFYAQLKLLCRLEKLQQQQ